MIISSEVSHTAMIISLRCDVNRVLYPLRAQRSWKHSDPCNFPALTSDFCMNMAKSGGKTAKLQNKKRIEFWAVQCQKRNSDLSLSMATAKIPQSVNYP